MECRYCGEYLAGDLDRIGARCPRCREPMYEKPESARRRNEPELVGGEPCAIHAAVASLTRCQRCNTPVCAVCRSRWLEEILCVNCLEKTMEVKHVRPEEVKAHLRQALLGLCLGAAAWVTALLAGVPLLGLHGVESDQHLLLTAGILLLVSLLPALFGLGMAAAAVRVRGPRLKMATWALILAGSHVGAVLGLMLFAVWNR